MSSSYEDIEDAAALWAVTHPGALEYVEDFMQEWQATLRDAVGRAILSIAYQRAWEDGRDRGGQACCGATGEWHRPWCDTGPRRYRNPAA